LPTFLELGLLWVKPQKAKKMGIVVAILFKSRLPNEQRQNTGIDSTAVLPRWPGILVPGTVKFVWAALPSGFNADPSCDNNGVADLETAC